MGFIGGAIIATNGANINISRSKFEDNRADCGGAIFGDNSMINITNNVSFVSNYATQYGGVLCSNRSVMTTISASTFNKNHDGRGVLWSVNSVIIIEISEFHANGGGVLAIFYSTIVIQACKFDRNGELGVLNTLQSTITIEGSKFDGNSAHVYGGILSFTSCNVTIRGSEFNSNIGGELGGVLSFEISTIML